MALAINKILQRMWAERRHRAEKTLEKILTAIKSMKP